MSSLPRLSQLDSHNKVCNEDHFKLKDELVRFGWSKVNVTVTLQNTFFG